MFFVLQQVGVTAGEASGSGSTSSSSASSKRYHVGAAARLPRAGMEMRSVLDLGIGEFGGSRG